MKQLCFMVQTLGALVYNAGLGAKEARKAALEHATKNPGTTFVITRAVGQVYVDQDGVATWKVYPRERTTGRET